VFLLSLRLIAFGGCLAHLAYLENKFDQKTATFYNNNNINKDRGIINYTETGTMQSLLLSELGL